MALELTAWLNLVWAALDESNPKRRDTLLMEANQLLEENRGGINAGRRRLNFTSPAPAESSRPPVLTPYPTFRTAHR